MGVELQQHVDSIQDERFVSSIYFDASTRRLGKALISAVSLYVCTRAPAACTAARRATSFACDRLLTSMETEKSIGCDAFAHDLANCSHRRSIASLGAYPRTSRAVVGDRGGTKATGCCDVVEGDPYDGRGGGACEIGTGPCARRSMSLKKGDSTFQPESKIDSRR